MTMRLQYRILTGDSSATLEKAVAEAMAGGWRVQGGVSAAMMDAGDAGAYLIFSQAVTRRIKPNPLAGCFPIPIPKPAIQ